MFCEKKFNFQKENCMKEYKYVRPHESIATQNIFCVCSNIERINTHIILSENSDAAGSHQNVYRTCTKKSTEKL